MESQFLNDFLKEYENSNEYDFTILFDDFYENFINKNSLEYNDELYEKLYNLVENKMIEVYGEDN